jgi:hypothetical protein
MQNVTVIIELSIIAEQGSVAETERQTNLAGNHNAVDNTDAIARKSCIGQEQVLDRSAVFLSATKGQILDVVCVCLVGICAGRRRVYCSKAGPGFTLLVSAGCILGINYTMVNTNLILSVANVIPYKFRHKRPP